VAVLKGTEFPRDAQLNVISYHPSELLIGTDKGLFQLSLDEKGTTIIAQKWTEDLQSIPINCIAQDSLGNSWIGTAGEGVYRYNSKKFKNFNSRRYLHSPYIRFIAVDDKQNLWLADATQISQIELDPEQSIVLNSSNLEEVNELGRLEPNYRAVLSDEDGSMWFGTINGLIRFTEGMSYPDPTEPPLALKDLLVNNNSLSWDTTEFSLNRYGLPEKPVFDYDENQLTIKFFATEPSAQDKVVYQYKLEGYSSDWSPISTETSASFPRLPPGDYTFMLRARNRDGVWNSSPLTYSFEIKAPFYQQPWLIVLAALLLASVVAGFIRLRLGVLKRRNLALEERVSERTAELDLEKRKSDELLLNILPRETAEELKENGAAKAMEYPMVSVLFSDFKGFTRLAEKMNSEEVVATLDECFRAFDQHTDELGIEKIKTIGDAYMCASGLPHSNERHAHRLVEFAFRMLEEVEKLNRKREESGKEAWPIRIGIHSGPVVAGVVGKKKFAYDIWGDTVNTAARMESSGEAGRINVSRSTRDLIADEYQCISRGKLEAKNKGALEMYFVEQKKA
jgi:class 3 adenylate cyclase